MDNYGRYEFEQNQEVQYQPAPAKKPENHNERGKKTAKKIGAIALSAVLFGGIAGGTMAAVNYAAMSNISSGSAGNQDAAQQTGTQKTSLQTTTLSSESSSQTGTMDVSQVASSVMPSIVSITNQSVQEVENYYSMFGFGGTYQTEEVESSGSGIIIGENDTELLIVTNNHVVSDADTLTVGFIDGSAYEANIKGTDSDNDLAVIAVKLEDISQDTMSQIKVAVMGDSEQLEVGQQVVAIGNALGYGQSVTTGIVSALNRQVSQDSDNGFIQTDAAINPGNSGGALLNMNGEVVGINSAKLASTEVEGMGYAIPMSTAKPIVEELMNKVTREKVSDAQASALSISGSTVDSNVSNAYGLPQGVYVAEVKEGGAADRAGIVAGSVITKFDGTDISSIEELKQTLQYYAAGETVDVTIEISNNGQYEEKTVQVTLDKAETEDTVQESQGNMQDSILKQQYLR